MEKRDKGIKGELLAEHWLKRFLRARILARNFRSPFGEIDLVARVGDYLLFVEVKTRESIAMGLPEEAVTEEKKERLRRGALSYLIKHGYDPEETLFRFDVITVYMHDGKTRIHHYPSAF